MFLCRKFKDKFGRESHPSSMDIKFVKGCGPRAFQYKQLADATQGFEESRKIGQGAFGVVYRGWMEEINFEVAVKRLRKFNQGINEYEREVKILSQLKHKHLVQLLGWCHDEREYLIVYDFMPNGSLADHLFEGKSELDWKKRYKIARGLASAMLYLHEEVEPCVLHRDIKPENIMLDKNYEARLGDFGIAMLVDSNGDYDTTNVGGTLGPQTTYMGGTLGYIPPESLATTRATKKSDMYGFGVVLLEIACGRRWRDLSLPYEERYLVEWVWSHYGKMELLDVEDPNLCTDMDEDREVVQVLVVGLWCAHPDPNHRPSITQAHQVLNFEAALPTLSSTMPLAEYGSPRLRSSNYEVKEELGSSMGTSALMYWNR